MEIGVQGRVLYEVGSYWYIKCIIDIKLNEIIFREGMVKEEGRLLNINI